jgi:hypothetical protein
MPLASCASQDTLRAPIITAPLVGAIIFNVGAVKSNIICVDPVRTIPLAKLVNVVMSVLVHWLDVRTMSVYAVWFKVPANVLFVSPCIVYHTGSVI